MVTKREHETAVRQAFTAGVKCVLGLDDSNIDVATSRAREATGLPVGQLRSLIEQVRYHTFSDPVASMPSARALPLAVSYQGAAEHTSLSIKTIQRAVGTRELVVHWPTSGKAVFLMDDLRAWIERSPTESRRRTAYGRP